MPEGGDQRLWRVTQDKVAGNQTRRGTDLLLAVEGIEQSGPDLLVWGSGTSIIPLPADRRIAV